MNKFVVAVVHVFDVDVDVDAVNVYAEIVVAVASGGSVDVYVDVDVGVVTKQLVKTMFRHRRSGKFFVLNRQFIPHITTPNCTY
jgi:hypothetical protein